MTKTSLHFQIDCSLQEPSRRIRLLAKPLAVAALAAALLGSAAARSAELDAATIEAAKQEGAVNFYSAAVPPQNDRLAQAFKEAYGIDVTVVRAATSPLLTRLEGELQANANQADVLDIGDRAAMEAMGARGLLADITGLPNYGSYPEPYKYQYLFQTGAHAQTVGFNTNKVKAEDISGWEAIVDPKWKGLVSLVDPRSSNTTAAFYYDLEQLLGIDYLKKLAAQEPKWSNSIVPASQLLVSGEAAIGFPFAVSIYPGLKESGAPIDFLILPQPNTGPVQSTSILAQAPHPNAARLFLNFMVSPEGQSAWMGGGYGASFLPGGAEGTFDLGEGFHEPPKLSPEDLARISGALGLQ